jgi:predicted AlkP superfamily phosphohydrolase/phosphomutase
MAEQRTIILGLDGATFDLLDPLIEAGDLPMIKRLRSEGVSGILQSWPNTNSAAAWSSMITGYNSGQHGIYHFAAGIVRRGASWQPVTGADRKKDPFWRILSDAGQRVGVINVPITYPADKVNGFVLAGMDTPGINSPGFAHPAELREELKQQGIDYRIDVANLGPASKRDPHRLPKSVEQMIETRGRALLHLMRTHPWDALMAVFVATDRVQHYFWPRDLHSVGDPDWSPIRRVYQQIDSIIGQVVEAGGADTNVLLVSDHGFGPERPAKSKLNQVLEQAGMLRYRKRQRNLSDRALRQLLVTGRLLIPEVFQDRLARAMPGLHLRAVNQHRFSGIDWPSTRAFAGPHGSRVWINLEGRELEGIVPQQAYDEVREEVRSLLLSLTDEDSGKSLVRAVHRREEIYRGPHTDEAADLLIRWDYETVRDTLCINANGKRIVVRSSSATKLIHQWSGTHRPEGILVAWGPGIRRGAKLEGATLCDIAPTVLYLQHQPVPDDMDGRVLTGALEEAVLRQRPVRFSQPAVTKQPAASGLDASEKREIEERLRGLGYIE